MLYHFIQYTLVNILSGRLFRIAYSNGKSADILGMNQADQHLPRCQCPLPILIILRWHQPQRQYPWLHRNGIALIR